MFDGNVTPCTHKHQVGRRSLAPAPVRNCKAPTTRRAPRRIAWEDPRRLGPRRRDRPAELSPPCFAPRPRRGHGGLVCGPCDRRGRRTGFRDCVRPPEDRLLHRHAGDGRRPVQRGSRDLEGALDHSGRIWARLPVLDYRPIVRLAERADRRAHGPRRGAPSTGAHPLRTVQRGDRRRRARRPCFRREGREAEELALVLSAGFAAFAGVILADRLASGSPTLAAELLLPSIAAVVVGGTAIPGESAVPGARWPGP